MTTAVLNSVESDKSGVASAVNGAIRETGFAFGVALLGTVMNQRYRSGFNGSSKIQALREPGDPATAARPVRNAVTGRRRETGAAAPGGPL